MLASAASITNVKQLVLNKRSVAYATFQETNAGIFNDANSIEPTKLDSNIDALFDSDGGDS